MYVNLTQNLVRRQDGRGSVVNYTYDGLNRLRWKTYTGSPAAPNVTYCYDGRVITGDGTCGSQTVALAHGQLSEVGTTDSKTSFTAFEALGRVTGSTQTTTGLAPFSFQYGYLPAGLGWMQYPSGRRISDSYDFAGRPASVTGVYNGVPTPYGTAQYAAHDAVKQLDLGNGVRETWSFNGRLQPSSLTATKNGSVLLGLQYGYCPNEGTSCSDNNGNLASQRISFDAWNGAGAFNKLQTYAYDGLNRLTEAKEDSGSAWLESNGYDAYGNRWVAASDFAPDMGVPGSADSYSTLTNHLVKRCNAGTGCDLAPGTYDAAGNIVNHPDMGLMGYDAENRLTAGSGVEYTYDGQGQRVKRVSATATAWYAYDAFGNLAVANTSGGAVPASTPQYVTADHLGSTRLVTDGTATVVRHDYRPFGKEILQGTGGRTAVMGYAQAPDRFALKFTGKERDEGSGLDYFGARYFSGAQGRFTSPDAPLIDQWEQNPQSWNLYSYVRNNPLRFTDADGRECKDGKDEQGQPCFTVDSKKPKGDDPEEAPPGLSPLDQLTYGAIFGHHGLPEWSKIAKDTSAYRFFSRWFTGPLQNPQANYYDVLHRSLNQAARKMVGDYLQGIGKTSLSQLTKEEVKVLARQLLNSNAPGVQDFMTRLERLNPGSVGRLGSLINSIDIGSGFVFLAPGQEQLFNYQSCGRSTCGSGPVF